MPLQQIEKILQRHMGLNAAVVGRSAVHNAVRRRMHVHGCASVADYHRHLLNDLNELDQLTETVVIPETWFFRDRRPFDALARFARNHVQTSEAPLRLLSVPCSTGEEPYSMAITLLEAGLQPQRFELLAIDISARALAQAGHGAYGPNSFRGDQDPAVLGRYFSTSDQNRRVTDQVRRAVKFRQFNLLDESFSHSLAPFHVVFCRNLLIYFDEPTKRRCYEVLHHLLLDDGLIFFGHAECGLVPADLYKPGEYLNSFGFRKAPPVSHGHRHPRTSGSATVRRSPRHAARSQREQAPRRGGTTAPPKLAPTGAAQDLSTAAELADRGDLAAARILCERHLRARDHQAQAYFQLGLIEVADGQNAQAIDCFRKTVYLCPDHHEALIHWSMLLAHQGDAEGATRLRQRAARLADKAAAGETTS